MGIQQRNGHGPHVRPHLLQPRTTRHRMKLPHMIRRREARRTAHRQLMLLLVGLLGLLLLLALFAVGGIAVAYAEVSNSLKPRLEVFKDHRPFQPSQIYDRNGVLLYEIFDQGRREPVPLEAIAPNLIRATIAIEDSSF